MNERLESREGRPVLRIERRLHHPIETVWEAITWPDQLSSWYPFRVVEMEFRPGGTIMFDDGEGTQMTATIQEIEPPRLFSFSEHAPDSMPRESDDLVQIELVGDDDSCLLIFTHVFDDRPAAAMYATGWSASLEGLNLLLKGQPIDVQVDFVNSHEANVAKFGLDEGSLQQDQHGWTIQFERQLVLPVERVWSELLSDANSVQVAIGDSPPDPFLVPHCGQVEMRKFDPPRLLSCSCEVAGGSTTTVRWELSQGTGPGARLLVTETGLPHLSEHVDGFMTEWASRIERLARQVAKSAQEEPAY